MAVTNNVLNAINVFSSTSVFNSNKGSVGANDLNFIKQTTAELATEGGGIIAQSLGTNGYVKFANGLILQWGLISTSGSLTLQTITYFLSFGNTNYSVFLTPIWTANPGHADYTCASEHNSYHTVSGTKCYNYQEQKIRWLAIGI